MAAGLRPGHRLDRYVIENLLGEGGMGAVYRAVDEKLRRRVALKVVKGDGNDAEARLRLLREARVAATLNHPNIVTVFDVGESDGVAFIAMELVSGVTLRSRVGDGTPLTTRVNWLIEIARGLEAAHRAGMIHRDVKPENVLVQDDGRIKVLDFGIARPAPGLVVGDANTLDDALVTLTAAGALIGTPMYLAPEQLKCEPVDHRADQFAWGILSYQLLTSRFPWPTDGVASLVTAILQRPFSFLDGDGLEPHVVATLLRATHKDPSQRFASITEAAEALIAAPASSKPRVASRLRKPFVAGAVLIALAAIVAVIARRTAPIPSRAPSTIDGDVGVSLGRVAPLTDRPIPASGNPAAAALYREGLQEIREALGLHSILIMNRVLKLDPLFAAAPTRIVALQLGNETQRAAAYRQAAALQSALDAHDKEIVRIADPLYAAERDVREAYRRADAAVKGAPNDEEFLWMRAAFAMEMELSTLGKAPTDTVELLRDLIARDPTFAYSYWALGGLLAARGQIAEGEAIAKRCLELVPHAGSCLSPLRNIANSRGQCREGSTLARQRVAVDRENPWAQRVLGYQLSASNAEASVVLSALDQATALEGNSPSSVRWPFYVSRGMFEGAGPALDEAMKAPSESRFYWWTDEAMIAARAMLLEEVGRPEDARTLVRATLDKLDAGGVTPDLDGLASLMGIGVRVSAISVPAASASALIPPGARAPSAAVIARGKALTAALIANDMATAKAALVSIDRVTLDGAIDVDDQLLLFARGRARALAEDLDGAAVDLEKSAKHCAIEGLPFTQAHAALLWGGVLERRGEKDKACSAYELVVSRWGQAPKSTTATNARARRTELRCQ